MASDIRWCPNCEWEIRRVICPVCGYVGVRKSTPDPEPTDALVEDLKKAMDALKDARLKWDPEGSAYTLEEAAYGHVLAAVSEAMTALARLRSMGEPDGWEVECDTDWGPGWHYGGDTQEEAHERGRQMIAYTRRVRPYWKARYGEPVTVATPKDEPEEGR